MSGRTLSSVMSPLARDWPAGFDARGVARAIAPGVRVPRPSLPDLRGGSRPDAPRQAGLWTTLRAAWRRHRTRGCLAELDGYLLKDIGVSYAEAEAEANKPFWRA